MKTTWLTVGLLLTVTGCAHTEPAPVRVETAAAPTPPPEPEKAAGPKSCSSDGECGPAQLCIRNACVDISKGLTECQMFRVHFEFNSTDFDPAAKTDLTRMARCLHADQALSVTIEGNADERGTEEYNLQLGSKRASTIEKYLVALGVTPSQVQTISYGENKPLCTEKDEACWAKNRRAAVKPSNAPGHEPKDDKPVKGSKKK